MILNDTAIRRALDAGRVVIDPLGDNAIQPASVDVRLGDRLRIFRPRDKYLTLSPKEPTEELTELIQLGVFTDSYHLHPDDFILGLTVEHITLPPDLVASVNGKSSLGRLGLLVHATAGFIDPGWSGRITLELKNIRSGPILLYPGMPIAQIAFSQMTGPAARPYGSKGLGSKYQGADEPGASQYHKNFQGAVT
jgi:dCTP deaminase